LLQDLAVVAGDIYFCNKTDWVLFGKKAALRLKKQNKPHFLRLKRLILHAKTIIFEKNLAYMLQKLYLCTRKS